MFGLLALLFELFILVVKLNDASFKHSNALPKPGDFVGRSVLLPEVD